MTATTIILGALVGIIMGLLGAGGSILSVPIFHYLVGFAPKQAIAMSLGVVSAVSLLGSVGHWRRGNLDFRVVVWFAPFAMTGTYAGTHLSRLLSGEAQLLLFGIVMMLASFFMFRTPGAPARSDRPERVRLLLAALAGAGVGVTTGLVGVGGGFMIVPALVIFVDEPMHRAVGTSLLIISLNATTGFVGYLGHQEIPWAFVAGFTAAAFAGMVAGVRLFKHVPTRILTKAFAGLLFVVAIVILAENGLGVG